VGVTAQLRNLGLNKVDLWRTTALARVHTSLRVSLASIHLLSVVHAVLDAFKGCLVGTVAKTPGPHFFGTLKELSPAIYNGIQQKSFHSRVSLDTFVDCKKALQVWMPMKVFSLTCPYSQTATALATALEF
jgi:hypothetical protein